MQAKAKIKNLVVEVWPNVLAKLTMPQEYISIISIYEPNNRPIKYIKQS